MPRINLTSKGLSWAQPLIQPDGEDLSAAPHDDIPETAYAAHGTPVLGPLPDSIGSETVAAPGSAPVDDSDSGVLSQLLKGPAIVSTNLADSTPVGFALYILVLAAVFYSLNLWINVLSHAVSYFDPSLAIANWSQLPGPQLTMISIACTLLIKYVVDVVRSYSS